MITKQKYFKLKLEKRNMLQELTSLNVEELSLLCMILATCDSAHNIPGFTEKYSKSHTPQDMWNDIAFLDRARVRDKVNTWWLAGPPCKVEISLNRKLGFKQ